ncbi:tRNA (adenine-N1-)-methyltransferase catalytic subunit [Strigomonas culicis]|uniref:tRNA (adenine(58)-N(1))-methyltransferase n=1 Tax=Strigomonas culicis TaxID=28005 RepID=S9W7D0_9TRYP|nr:tRNA (adenine-N1-)-methyltransferase catalytic subunit [Strigomonas culicis]EPY31905.1 tRNA (adenine-N1-)-methyltransferase catalytic subunit [Strigomonas culicis]|eukprot:EPY27493.1 tRNA (adenine-N1-)-methyltransferase catalytic subunit [Strigomonas culicis]
MLSPRGVVAKEGDVVLIFRGYRNLQPLCLKKDEVYHSKEGKFAHNDIIGRPLNQYVSGKPNSKADPSVPSVLVLQASTDLWTQAVRHRTQIIYDTDIAVITLQLRLGPGKVVVEAGTGSGSLTHSLARAVAPSGTVHTCDFHQGRCLEARDEFRANGLADLVVSHWRDVCLTSTAVAPGAPAVAQQTAPLPGFGLPAHSVDAVFLDVPAPWAAIDNAVHVLRPGGVLCTFSPCIEQTQRTAERLRAAPHDFIDIRTVEALTKDFSPVYKRAREEGGGQDRVKFRASLVSKGHSAYLTFARRRLQPLRPDGEEDEAMA